MTRTLCLLALVLLAASPPATAQAKSPAAQAPPMREAQVAPGSFHRGTPVPAWVRRVALPATTRTEPLVARLADLQIRVSDEQGQAQYFEVALQANAASALGPIGQVSFSYMPEYQRAYLHSVGIWRDGAFTDRTASANIRFLERETGFERGVYSGAITVAILLPDIRVGDTLHYAVTFDGSNPVFGGRFAAARGWEFDEPVELRRVTLIHPRKRAIQWQLGGDLRRPPVEPRISEEGEARTLVFEERGIDPLRPEPAVPDNFLFVSPLQFSEYRDWNEVARWAQSLFAPVAAESEEFKSLVTRFKAVPGGAARAAAALNWVQSEIRNFSLALGESSHRPHAPDLVLRRRFGDCKDKTYLLLTLLRQLDIEAVPMLVALRAPRRPGRELANPLVFDHAVVQARIDGVQVVLDPTDPPEPVPVGARWPLPPLALGLVATEGTQQLVAVGLPPQAALPALVVEERMRIPALAPAGTIESSVTFAGARASAMRRFWDQANREQRRESSLGIFGRRYPGIELAADPQVVDDREANRLTITSRYNVPQLALSEGGNWIVAFEPWSLRGVLNLPETATRRLPLVAAEFPVVRQYKVVVEWPAEVNAIHDPTSEVVDGPLFRGESRSTFRGNRFVFTTRIQTTGLEVAADQVPRLIADYDKFVRTFEYRSVVRPGEIGAAGAPGMTSAQAAAMRHARQLIDRATSSIRDKGLAGDKRVDALCERSRGFGFLEQIADGLRDTSEAIRIVPASPDAWSCHGEMLLANGDFVGADEAVSKSLALGANEAMALRVRGRIRLHAGRLHEAAADFARSAAAFTDIESSLYARLWQAAALLRAGKPLPQELRDLARRESKGSWPRPAFAMLAGVITPQALWAEVERLEGNDRVLASEEAWFYLGQHHLARGEVVAAREAFEKCRALGIVTYVEHEAARQELVRLAGAGGFGS